MFVFEWKLHRNGSYSKRGFLHFIRQIYIDNGNAHAIVIGFASLNPCVCYSEPMCCCCCWSIPCCSSDKLGKKSATATEWTAEQEKMAWIDVKCAEVVCAAYCVYTVLFIWSSLFGSCTWLCTSERAGMCALCPKCKKIKYLWEKSFNIIFIIMNKTL